MIIVRLKGGLGNQLFQYALGRKLTHKGNDVLKLDISTFDSSIKNADTYRPYKLQAFNISAPVATNEEVYALRYPHGLLSVLVEKIQTKILRQYHVGFEPHILTRTKDVYLDGYWQSPKYFEDIRNLLLEDFTLKASLSTEALRLLADIEQPSSVSLHIRRGDYISNPKVQKRYGSCSPLYYKEAITAVTDRVPDPHWFVFSDDIPWVQENLDLPSHTTFVTGTNITDTEELFLMSRCAHNVIANSSFSWWGAWLNQNPKKIVVAPRPWFDYDKNFEINLIPQTWIQLQKN